MDESVKLIKASDDTVAEHCRRTAAFCNEVGRARGVRAPQIAALVEAALEHEQAITNSLVTAVIAGLELESADSHQLPSGTLKNRLLEAFVSAENNLIEDERILLRILEAAHIFDESLEFSQYEPTNLTDTIRHFRESPDDNPYASTILAHLESCTKEHLTCLIPQLPVFPAVAVQAVSLLINEQSSLGAIKDLISSDQVLAGKVVRAANCTGLIGTHPSIKNLDAAVRRMGTSATIHVILREALGPLMTIPNHREMWTHAQEAADISRSLARLTKHLDPDEAYLLGLLHDSGTLLLQLAPKPARELKGRLLKSGCPLLVAEILSCGTGHAQAGGEVLRAWRLSADQCEAVIWHHEPELVSSRLAAMLYLVEFLTASCEDLPSNRRLTVALERLGLTLQQVSDVIP